MDDLSPRRIDHPTPPSARRTAHPSWRLVAALSAMTLLIQGCTVMALGLYLSPVAHDIGSMAGAATLFLLAMSLANLPVGWALQRVKPRLVLGAGIALTVSGCAAAALARTTHELALALALTGSGVSAATIVPGVAIITHHHVAARGLALALFLGASVLAGAALPPLVSLAIGAAGWRTALLLSALAIALLCAPLLWLVPPERIGGTGPASPPRALIEAAWRNADVLRLLVAMTLIQLAINGILFSAVDALVAQGVGRSGAVAAYSIANLLGLPALLLGGALADRVGARRALIGTALLLAAGTASLMAVQAMGLAGVALFVLLWGVASALPGQSGSMLLADVVEPRLFAGLLGFNTAIASLVGAIAPAWTEQLRESSGGFALPIAVYAALALLAVPFIAAARPRASKP